MGIHGQHLPPTRVLQIALRTSSRCQGNASLCPASRCVGLARSAQLRCTSGSNPDGRSMAAILTCQHCGGELATGDRYCGICGGEASPAPFDERAPDPAGALADIAERLRRATIGEFEIGPELGHGGMAAVFLAHEIALDRKVAIKVMSPGLLLDDGM